MNTVTRLSVCLVVALVCFAIVPGASASVRGNLAIHTGHSWTLNVTAPGQPGFVLFSPRNDRDRDGDRDHRNHKPVPEGGSTVAYLLLAGATCFGAMFLVRKQRTA